MLVQVTDQMCLQLGGAPWLKALVLCLLRGLSISNRFFWSWALVPALWTLPLPETPTMGTHGRKKSSSLLLVLATVALVSSPGKSA